MNHPVLLGIAGSLFFAVTFILNRSMDLEGGSWLWSASLRFWFMAPLLWGLLRRPEKKAVHDHIFQKPGQWLLWSTVGFGLFYAPLTYAAAYGESWLIAGLWQVTIVLGAVLAVFWGEPFPRKGIMVSLMVLGGVYLLQSEIGQGQETSLPLGALAAILLAAAAYPLGNRMMMRVCGATLSALQRIYGMTLCSLPGWALLSGTAVYFDGWFGISQAVQSFIVALSSGVIATWLFFRATDLVRQQPHALAVVEATQAGEVVFALFGGCLILGDAWPSLLGLAGLVIIVAGILFNSLGSAK